MDATCSNEIEATLGSNAIEIRPLGATTPTTVASQDEDGFAASTSFWKKHRKHLLELAWCCLFFVVGHGLMIVDYIYHHPNPRPIPFQYLSSTEEYVRNLVYDQADQGQTIDLLGVALLCLAPICVQLLLIAFFSNPQKKIVEIQKTLCTYAVAVTLNNVTTVVFKNYVGYLRPIFYSACQPNDSYTECTQEDMADYITSFPSGHTSLAFCVFVLLSAYLEHGFGLSSIQRNAVADGGRVMRVYIRQPAWHRVYSVLAVLPVGVAIWVGTSRIVDNFHFPADVVAGALLGSFVAIATHRVWFLDPLMQKIVA